jgi:hypothetical protein
LSADGVLTLPGQAPPSFAGAVTVAGPPEAEAEDDGAEARPRSPWTEFRGVGQVEVTPQALTVAQAQLSYGAMARPLVLEGSGRLDLGAEPRFDVSVTARQIDLDRAVGGGPDKPVAIGDAVDAIIAALPGVPIAQLPGAVKLTCTRAGDWR